MDLMDRLLATFKAMSADERAQVILQSIEEYFASPYAVSTPSFLSEEEVHALSHVVGIFGSEVGLISGTEGHEGATMTIEEAIKIANEMNAWRRREGEMPEPMPHTPREFGRAIDTLVEHAKRTTWKPIETLTEDAENVLLCVKGGLYVTNGVRHDDDKQWDVFSDPAYGTIEDLKKVYGFWMPAINPPKTESK